MQKNVISPRYLPAYPRLNLTFLMAGWLFLDKFQMSDAWYGVFFTLYAILTTLTMGTWLHQCCSVDLVHPSEVDK